MLMEWPVARSGASEAKRYPSLRHVIGITGRNARSRSGRKRRGNSCEVCPSENQPGVAGAVGGRFDRRKQRWLVQEISEGAAIRNKVANQVVGGCTLLSVLLRVCSKYRDNCMPMNRHARLREIIGSNLKIIGVLVHECIVVGDCRAQWLRVPAVTKTSW